METRTRTCLELMFLGFPFLTIVAFTVLLAGSTVHADGKLRRVKEAVRKNEDRSANRPDSNQGGRNDSNENSSRHGGASHADSQHNDRHSTRDNDRSHRGSHRNHGKRSSGFSFFSQPRPYVQPIVIPISAGPSCEFQEHIVYENVTPVQPGYSQYAYETPATLPSDFPIASPVPQTVYEPIGEPVANEQFESVDQGVVIPGNNVGSDWFATNSSRFWATVGSDFDGISTAGLGLHIQSPGGIGLDSSVMTLRESTEYYRDHLWIGDVNLVYEVLNRGDVRGRAGLGVNWLNDSWGAEAGFNLTAGVDIRLTDRMTLSGEGDVGNLGDADFFHYRVNLARRFESCEWILGFDHYDIGGAEVNAGFTGIQFRF